MAKGVELKRKMYDRLLEWKRRGGKTALFIDGARRVGKSYVAKRFGEREYRSHLVIDFAKKNKDIIQHFENGISDIDSFLGYISRYYDVPFYERDTLIIFDEVQDFPLARQFIKYLVEDGRYDYLETGSLIRVRKNFSDILIPSEEEHVEMFPLDFEEWLWANGHGLTMDYVRECFSKRKPMGAPMHRKTLREFREYMLVGGMPQAVLAYLADPSFREAELTKRDILKLYREDVAKLGPRQEEKVGAIFSRIPSELGKENGRFNVSSLESGVRIRDYQEALYWLEESMICNVSRNCLDPSPALALTASDSLFKCYLADTGLFFTMAFENGIADESEVYRALLFDKVRLNEGMFFENAVAQALRSSGHGLYYHYKRSSTDRGSEMEVDFLLPSGKKIMPIEVKSAGYDSHKSLDRFLEKFHDRVAEPVIVYQKDLAVKDGILHIPAYMACLL